MYNIDILAHSGVMHRSGRYKEGTGETPYQCHAGFYSSVQSLRKEGLSEKEIADYFGLSLKDYRSEVSNAKNQEYAANAAMALRLKDKGYSNVAIAKRLNVSEGTVRNMLKPANQVRATRSQTTADILKKDLSSGKYIDIGSGVENQMGISRQTLDNSVKLLMDEGYTVHYIQVEQLGTGNKTSLKVLAPPDTTWSEVNYNRDKISFPGYKSNDKGDTFNGVKDPISISSKRVKVIYAEDGGTDKDGVIEIRRGVEDLSLGNARYAQVRIAVDGTHYLKGMAIYNDNMPDGVDILFNTNKKKGTPMMGDGDSSVLKKVKAKSESDNIFGATIKPQTYYIGKDGKQHQSALNIVYEEGDWSKWSKTLSSQFLSKQSGILAKKQLKLAYDLKMDEYDEIMKVSNSVVRKALLDKFADRCDSMAVDLKAAGLPRQASKVILPLPDIKENQIYAPSFRNGEKVVLVRHPHGGTFEIPELVVNNNQKTAKRLFDNAVDAVGIHPKVAERLSGADFDGDTVLVIPTAGANIKTSAPLKGLKNFDPKTSYPAYPGMIKTGSKGSGFNKQREMGEVSNLITDMTLKGAPPEHIAAAVRHSMVVIDAEKHNLNYKQSYVDNNIAYLKQRYQGRSNAGASTLISKAKGETHIPVRKEITNPKNMTAEELKRYSKGEKVYRETGETYRKSKVITDPNVMTKDELARYSQGKTVRREYGSDIIRTTKSTRMADTKDAYSLSSGTKMEAIYAEHANKLKALANKARQESRNTPHFLYSKEAHKTYSKEVESLKDKLNDAKKNRPLERKANILGGTKYKSILSSNPNLDNDQKKKLKNRCLTDGRIRAGAKKKTIKITDQEWKAIQAGAISENMLKQIVSNADLDTLKQMSMPRQQKALTSAKRSRARSMAARGYTLAEIADALGVSTSTIQDALNS